MQPRAFGASSRRGLSRVATSGLSRAGSTAPPLELFEGLEDLEEEPEEEEEAKEEPAPEAPSIRTIVPKGDIGSGITELQRLEREYHATGKEPEIGEEALLELHAALARDAPKCPSISAVAWIIRTLEDLAIEEDEILEDLAVLIMERADELGPQDLLNVVCSYGDCYWSADDELLDAFDTAIRRQLDDFTPAEVVKLANAMMRMGGVDDTRHVGMFFEMRQRVNLPQVEHFMRRALDVDSTVTKKPSEETMLAFKALENMPNKKLKAKAMKLLQFDLEEDLPKYIEEARSNELLRDGWDPENINQLRLMTGQEDDAAGEAEEEEGPPQIRFEDLAAASDPSVE